MPTVALFVTCLGDQFAPHTVRSTVRLLEAAGCDVVVPLEQTCCGQPAITAGEPEAAARLASHYVDVFERYHAIVTPSGSCASTVRHWYRRLLEPLGRPWPGRAASLAQRTFELSQYLVDELGRPDLGARIEARVTLHDACHGLRNLGIREQPRVLLGKAGAEVVEMREPETCCGFGGSFSLEHGAVAAHLADDKLTMAAETGAQCVVTGDTACLMHLAARRERTGVGPRPLHIADVLAAGLEALAESATPGPDAETRSGAIAPDPS